MAKAEIDALMAAFFRLFAVCGGGCVDLSPIFDLFIPQGMIVKNTGPEPVVYDLKGFIAPREQLLNSGELSEFWEEEVAERTHIFGNIAQRLSLYRKGAVQSGVRFEAAGMKTTQFVRTPEGWRISALAWDDCRDGVEIPERYRTGDNGHSL
ncbi:MAG TPA: hypothetical protein VFE34_04055 [Dongiaceae bacterium]|nr:hypothetical protein [Dongiaceae bacterium]